MTSGGSRRNAGRPKGTTKPAEEKVQARTIKLTDKEYKTYLELGGAKWLRKLLNSFDF